MQPPLLRVSMIVPGWAQALVDAWVDGARRGPVDVIELHGNRLSVLDDRAEYGESTLVPWLEAAGISHDRHCRGRLEGDNVDHVARVRFGDDGAVAYEGALYDEALAGDMRIMLEVCARDGEERAVLHAEQLIRKHREFTASESMTDVAAREPGAYTCSVLPDLTRRAAAGKEVPGDEELATISRHGRLSRSAGRGRACPGGDGGPGL